MAGFGSVSRATKAASLNHQAVEQLCLVKNQH